MLLYIRKITATVSLVFFPTFILWCIAAGFCALWGKNLIGDTINWLDNEEAN